MPEKSVNLGQYNQFDFDFISTVQVAMHITNKSYPNSTNFKVAIDTGSANGFYSFAKYFSPTIYYHFIPDTTIRTRVPKYSIISAISAFNSGKLDHETKDTLVSVRRFKILQNDTTVNVINPN